MKKFKTLFAIASVALMTFATSCEKENLEEENKVENIDNNVVAEAGGENDDSGGSIDD